MKTRIAIVLGVVVLALAGATLAIGGGTGIWDDNHFAKPGSLGQVDLERYRGRVVYMVDVGDREVRVDAANGQVVAVSPRS